MIYSVQVFRSQRLTKEKSRWEGGGRQTIISSEYSGFKQSFLDAVGLSVSQFFLIFFGNVWLKECVHWYSAEKVKHNYKHLKD